MPSYTISSAWIASTIIAITFCIFYPLVLAFIANRRLRVSWRYFGFGALIFFLFQLISRVPAVQLIQGVLAPELRASKPLLYVWLIVLALTAALFEEVGRYIGYRWLMGREEKTWNKAVMYGLGHGGLESMLLVAGLALIGLVNVIVLSRTNLNMVPPSQHVLVAQQLAAVSAQPAWAPLLVAWERLWAVIFHVAMSVVVLQVFRRGQMGWLWLAIFLHTLLDGVTAFMPQLLGAGITTSLLIEGFVAVVGVFSLWLIWRLRDHPEHTQVVVDQPAVHVTTE